MSPARGALGRDVAVYGLASALVQVVAVVTTPVYARVLGPAGYGVLEVLLVAASFVITALLEAVGVAAVRLYFGETEERRSSLLSTGFVSVVTATAVAALVAVAAAGALSEWLLGGEGAETAIVAAALYLPLAVAHRFSAEVLRIQRRPWGYLVSSVTAAVVGGATGIVLVAGFDRGPEGVYYGFAAGAGAALVCNLVMAGRALAPRFVPDQLRQLLRFGGPLVAAALAGWSLVLVDRVILVQFEPLREVGYYGLANRLANVLLIAVYAFAAAWSPYILGLHHDDPAAERRVRADVLRHFLAGMAVLAVVVGLFSREVVALFAGDDFEPAAAVVPTLCLGFLLFSTVNVTQVPFLVEHRTGHMARLAVLAAAVNVGACFVLIPPWGIHGAAAATVAGFGVQAVAYLWAGQRLLPAPYDLGRLVAIVVLALPFLVAGRMDVESSAVEVALKTVLALSFAGLLVATKLVDLPRLRGELEAMFTR
jgi:O-antigen/teichoic acid export membrane protein